jgi:hypothetical protein
MREEFKKKYQALWDKFGIGTPEEFHNRLLSEYG